jgi:hypothetical protein
MTDRFNDAESSYDDFEAAVLGTASLPIEPAGFVIEGDTLADWALKRLGQLEQDRQARATFVAEKIAHLKAWQAQEDEKAASFEEFLTVRLRDYYAALKAAGKVSDKRKSYTLPHGRLTSRATPVEYEVVDRIALREWADGVAEEVSTELPLVATQREVIWGNIKPLLHVDADGTVVAEIVNTETGAVETCFPAGVRVKSLAGERFQAKPQI